jgi:electron transport complex protein RnfG
MANKESNKKASGNTLVHDTIMLTVITLIAGILLGGVYTITKKPIEEQNEKTKAEAYAAVFEGADFVDDGDIDTKLAAYNEQLAAGEIKADGMGETLSDVEVSEVMKAQVNGADAGYVVTCSGKGYGGSVTLALGVDLEGNVLGIQVTDCSNETPGLGQNSSTSWNEQYVGMSYGEQGLSVVKDNSGSTESGTINAISGATITSRAVTRAVNGALGFLASLSE